MAINRRINLHSGADAKSFSSYQAEKSPHSDINTFSRDSWYGGATSTAFCCFATNRQIVEFRNFLKYFQRRKWRVRILSLMLKLGGWYKRVFYDPNFIYLHICFAHFFLSSTLPSTYIFFNHLKSCTIKSTSNALNVQLKTKATLEKKWMKWSGKQLLMDNFSAFIISVLSFRARCFRVI